MSCKDRSSRLWCLRIGPVMYGHGPPPWETKKTGMRREFSVDMKFPCCVARGVSADLRSERAVDPVVQVAIVVRHWPNAAGRGLICALADRGSAARPHSPPASA